MVTDFSPAHQTILDSAPLRPGANIVDETIRYVHDGLELEGYIAWDASLDGPRPGVVVIHDWTGLREYPKARAQMLARLGYVGIAIDVYGAGVRFGDGYLPADGAAQEAGKYYGNLPLLRERVAAGFARATADDRIDSENIAVIGYCFGGSAAIEFARTGAPIRGTASFHGGLVTHEPADVAAVSAPLLILTGAADDVVPDDALVAFEDELRSNPAIDWQVVSYSGAPHAFTLPEIPNYRESADRRSWRALVDFLDEVFG